jgi:hypothetical protein
MWWVPLHGSHIMSLETCTTVVQSFFSFSVRGTYHMKKERLEAMKGES